MSNTDFTDVVVCGAGPVGLLIALGLAQQGIDTLIVGKCLSS
jgi:phenol 2-monooxygenase